MIQILQLLVWYLITIIQESGLRLKSIRNDTYSEDQRGNCSQQHRTIAPHNLGTPHPTHLNLRGKNCYHHPPLLSIYDYHLSTEIVLHLPFCHTAPT